MRISDGSSDVCSSDLRDPAGLLAQFFLADVVRPAAAGLADAAAHDQHVDQAAVVHVVVEPVVHARADDDHAAAAGLVGGAGELTRDLRSEEHTSELQSLMRISYAVFCLKKKTNRKTTVHKSSRKINKKLNIYDQ